ncbi:MAG: 50S ribosomal protein L17 [Candidatus Pacebacteria bacterium]|nr:50S ribosomal protein L17 [Candidatus Paceibacterota bacterium]
MRKGKQGRKLSRPSAQRKALKKSLISSLFEYEKIKTTEAKAKEIRPKVEKFITQAQRAGFTINRSLTMFFSPKITKKLIKEIAPRYKDMKGGYTRIIKLGARKSDGARMAIIELIKIKK